MVANVVVATAGVTRGVDHSGDESVERITRTATVSARHDVTSRTPLTRSKRRMVKAESARCLTSLSRNPFRRSSGSRQDFGR